MCREGDPTESHDFSLLAVFVWKGAPAGGWNPPALVKCTTVTRSYLVGHARRWRMTGFGSRRSTDIRPVLVEGAIKSGGTEEVQIFLASEMLRSHDVFPADRPPPDFVGRGFVPARKNKPYSSGDCSQLGDGHLDPAIGQGQKVTPQALNGFRAGTGCRSRSHREGGLASENEDEYA